MLPLESVSHWIFSQSKIHPSLCGYEAVSGALSGGIRWCLFLCYFVNYLIFISMVTSVCVNIIQHPAVSIAVSPGFFFRVISMIHPAMEAFSFIQVHGDHFFHFTHRFQIHLMVCAISLVSIIMHPSSPPFLKMAGLRVTSSRQTW